MRKFKIVHIINNDKFIKPFIDVIEENFDSHEHLFIFLYGADEDNYPIPKSENILNINNQYLGKKNIIKLSKVLNPILSKSDKIILHSLFSIDLINYFYFNGEALNKCYWVMWGGDLYAHVTSKKTMRNAFGRYRKSQVIKKIGGLITYIKGDYELAKEWYGARGDYHECLMYPSNTFEEIELPVAEHESVTLLVGNSADSSNNHFEIFEKLALLDDKSFRVICPLSYGDVEYAKEVAEEGRKVFRQRFIPLRDFVSYQDYLKILAQVDIAVFGHKRQQGMGNIITLLGLGKEVYMRSDLTSCQMFRDIGVQIYDIESINTDMHSLDDSISRANVAVIAAHFSEEQLIHNWRKIF